MVFSKEGCHLCEAVEAEIRSMEGVNTRLTVVDIEKDRALQAKYWARIPVISMGGSEVFEASMMDLEGRWRNRLRSILAGP